MTQLSENIKKSSRDLELEEQFRLTFDFSTTVIPNFNCLLVFLRRLYTSWCYFEVVAVEGVSWWQHTGGFYSWHFYTAQHGNVLVSILPYTLCIRQRPWSLWKLSQLLVRVTKERESRTLNALTLHTRTCLIQAFILTQLENTHRGLTQREACSIRVVWSSILWCSLWGSDARPLLIRLWNNVGLSTFGIWTHSSRGSSSSQGRQNCWAAWLGRARHDGMKKGV